MIPVEKKIERMLLVSRMYYEQDMNQNEIAKAIGISRPLVSVLLAEARACGIVTITINEVQSPEQLAAKQLESRFNLARAIVISDTESTTDTDNTVAAAAFDFCFNQNIGYKKVGISWGFMIGRMASYAMTCPDNNNQNGDLFPLIGGIGASYRSYHPNELARILSSKGGYIADYLHFPAFFDSESELEYVKGMESYKNMCRNWDEMDMAIVNVSNYPSYPDLGVEVRFDKEKMQKYAVGRMLAHFYDIKGELVTADFDNVMQCSFDHIKGAKSVTALCSSLLQPKAVIGALNTKTIDTLILPLSLADKVLENTTNI